MKKIPGRYPGGPSREGEGEAEPARGKSSSLPTVEELEGRASQGSQRRKASRRRKRVIVALVVSLAVAGGAGLWIGLESHRTEEELVQEMEAEVEDPVFDLEKQTDRIIDEIWKTEALERIPRNK